MMGPTPVHWAGHMARANPQWRSFDPEREVLAICAGPHTYISPRWYSHVNVPSWNYQSVHAYGLPRLEASFKLNQNRNAQDYDNMVAELRQRGDEYSHKVAEAMRRRQPTRNAKG